jgi:hypothetical protein
MAANDQLAERLQDAYKFAKNGDCRVQSEIDKATERIQAPFTYNLSESVKKSLNEQENARRKAKESVEKNPYSFG